MSAYPSRPRTLSYLINQSFKYYGLSFKTIFPVILLVVLVKDAYLYLGGAPANRWLYLTVFFIMALLEVYFWSVAWYVMNLILSGSPIRLNKAFREVYYKLSLIYAGFFALVIAACILFFVGYLLSNLVVLFFNDKSIAQALSILFFIGLPLTIFFVLVFLTLPLLVLNKLTVWQVFYKSIAWVGYRNWLRVFALYAAYVVVFFIISPATLHGKWLAQHYLSFIFDFIVLLIFGPLLVNFTLFLINDLRLRRGA